MVDFCTRPASAQVPIPDAPFHEWTMPDGTVWTCFHRTPTGYLLRFPELADFRVSGDGRQVQCTPVPDVSAETIQHLYLNQVLPLALSKLGKLVFHASAISAGGLGIAFVGHSGRGKSTLAASFASSGFSFLADDGMVLESAPGLVRAMPSHPSIRLWEDSQEALLPPDAAMAPAVQYTSKSRFLASDQIAFCAEPQPLHRVYFLGDAEPADPRIQPLRPSEVLIELVKHSFLLDTQAQELLSAHFDELSALSILPIFFRLDYPRCYADLPRVRQAILQHMSLESGG